MKSGVLLTLCFAFLIESGIVRSFKKSSSGTLIRDFRKILTRAIIPKDISGRDYEIFDTLNLVKRHGYPGEEHTVVTEDGYRLKIFRITGSPFAKKIGDKQIVFLQHGILWSSDAFVLRGPAYDLSFMLADAGYDVWMGNVRGNTYGRSHQTRNRRSPKFWDFSYHEMGTEDLPAMIDYVLGNTKEKSLYYVGHSMGATIAYVMLSLRPEYNAKIKLIVSLAPVTLWKHRLNPMQTFFSQIGLSLEETLNRIEVCEILPQTTILARQADQWCSEDAVSYSACLNMIFGFVGEDREQLNAETYELAKYLGNVTIIEAVPFGKFNHMDFIWARDVKELLYKRVLQLIA